MFSSRIQYVLGSMGYFILCCQTLFSWDTPASPHLASRLENRPVSDSQVLLALCSLLRDTTFSENDSKDEPEVNSTTKQCQGELSGKMITTTVIETAGGVLSPSSSSPMNRSAPSIEWGWSTQADLYSSLNIPSIFVGDAKLGGISVTLSSLEALWSRGYRVDAVVFIEGGNGYSSSSENCSSNCESGGIQFGKGNAEALHEYLVMNDDHMGQHQCLNDGIKNMKKPRLEMNAIVCLPSLPPMPLSLDDWYENNKHEFLNLHHLLCQKWMDNFTADESDHE